MKRSGKPATQRAAEFVGRFAANHRVGFAPSDEAIARAVELATRYVVLKRWGVREKLPHTKGTQDDLERFFRDAREGKLDVTEIVGVTADVRRLELLAEEYDASKNVPNAFKAPKGNVTPFDIERAAEGLKAAKNVIEAKSEVQSLAKDAAADSFDTVKAMAKVVPTWAWLAGGAALAIYIVSQVATVVKAFRR